MFRALSNWPISIILIVVQLFQSSIISPYRNYTDALLSNEYPQMNYNFESQNYQNLGGDSLSFGFWTVCIPQYTQYIHQSNNNSSAIPETGQFIFLLNYNNGLKFLKLQGTNQEHSFKLFGQSQNFSDYEIKCKVCSAGYELQKDQCILQCPKSCLECIKSNGQNLCIWCQQETQCRRMSISNNECIECPTNFQLCRKRAINEIQQINQLFNNDRYIIFSYQCLMIKTITWINFFGRAIASKSIDCSKSFQINLNLFCSLTDYEINIQQLKDEQDIQNFKKQNIILEDLISGQSFKEFENDLFYDQANQNSVSTIKIIIKGNKEQECTINTGSQNKNSVKTFLQQLIFKLTFNLSFRQLFCQKKFQYLETSKQFLQTIQKFYQKKKKSLKQIIFQSVYPQSIYFSNILYEQETLNSHQFQFYFENLNYHNIDDFTIQNSVLEGNESFIYIGKSIYNIEQDLLYHFKLQISLYNSGFCFLDNNIYNNINFSSWNIESLIQNSSIVKEHEQAIINKVILQQVFVDSKSLIALLFLIFTIITMLYQTTQLLINQKYQIHFSKFSKTIQKQQNFHFLILNSYTKVLYLGKANKMKVMLWNFKSQSFRTINIKRPVNLQNLKQQCYCIYESVITFQQLTINSFSKFQLETKRNFFNLYLMNLYIIRGQGLVEVPIYEPILLSISNTTVTQGDETLIKGLHTDHQSFQNFVKNQIFLSSFTIFSTKLLILENIEFYNIRAINAPIFYFQSANQIDKQQNVSIIFNNLRTKDNVLIQSADSAQQAIIYIDSSQISEIYLKMQHLQIICLINIIKTIFKILHNSFILTHYQAIQLFNKHRLLIILYFIVLLLLYIQNAKVCKFYKAIFLKIIFLFMRILRIIQVGAFQSKINQIQQYIKGILKNYFLFYQHQVIGF